MLEVIFSMKKSIFNIAKLTSKKFIITMLVCLAVVASAGIYSYNKIVEKLENQLESNNGSTLSNDVDEQVNNEQTDVTKQTEAVTEAEVLAENVPEDVAVEEKVMVKPIDGEIINSFSNGELVKSQTLNVWKTHDGIDISCNPDEKVKSMTSGVVASVKEDPMWGYCVIIDHGNGIEGHYYGLGADIPVTEGTEVAAGTVIGTVGNTAEAEVAEESHLHFGVKENGEWVDPAAMLSGMGS